MFFGDWIQVVFTKLYNSKRSTSHISFAIYEKILGRENRSSLEKTYMPEPTSLRDDPFYNQALVIEFRNQQR